jgi:cellulose synthase/poly-beta-1,6-N-acetylglucosamine synthase-like glycosyltransferase
MEDVRLCVQGKSIFLGEEKLYIRGVTYGPFRPSWDGHNYYNPEVVERDFTQIAANGLNAVRTYTVPPRWLLDIAQRHSIHVMVGLPWEQHLAFLDNRKLVRSIKERVRAGVRACADHPAILCYVIGNEIPAPMVRWYGRRRVERFLKQLYCLAKAEDPKGLVTYVSYPSTEYLQLSFVDFVSFNVYLEEQDRLEAYLARLHNIAEDRPVVMAEIGLDSLRNGEEAQAHVLYWQVQTASASGCAGTFIFSWTDEWFRNGQEIEDWAFGLTDRNRRPKPALAAVRRAFAEAPFPPDLPWPHISVVVCSYNGEITLPNCFDGLLKLEYPNFEVIVVDDGSSDATAAIAREYGFRSITTENLGLSNARNVGLEAATGEIVAYLDDDARPDPHWLTYLAATFLSTEHAGVGGPNITPPGDGPIAECVANAPGNPVHVLLSDREAEHIPGCNMAFRKACLQAIGGFDARFRVAGDDADVCWRLQQRGWTLGFNPAAMVWHHRRNSIRAYWKQQRGYGNAEALLEKKWPEKYNGAGHLVWAGRVYGEGLMQRLVWSRGRIYHGTWGSAPFQSLYQPASSKLSALFTMPEWYLVIIALSALCILGALWTPLLLALPLLALAVGASLVQAGLGAARATFAGPTRSRFSRLKLRSLTALLHLLQPLVRLCSRLRYGLTPWRSGASGLSLPWPRTITSWSERWQAPEKRLQSVETILQTRGIAVYRGGDYDRWDLEARRGTFGAVRLRMVNEEHGAGKQLVRFRLWPLCSPTMLVLTFLFVALCLGAALDQAWTASVILAGVVVLLVLHTLRQCAAATAAVLGTLRDLNEEEYNACEIR